MVSIVRRFPGTSCVHFMEGRCLREERLNPGLHREWRCRVLVAWEDEYERYLDRVERFRLDTETAFSIWEKRMGELMGREPVCPDRVEPRQGCCPGCGDQPVVPCALLWMELCLNHVPRCEGVCDHFQRPAPEPRTED